MFEHNLIELPKREFTHMRREDGCSYFLDSSGKRFYSVTKVVSYASRKYIEQWRQWVGVEEAERISSAAKARGSLLHECIEDYLHNRIPCACDLFSRMQPLLDRISNIRGIEISLHCDDLKLIGRADCVAEYEGIQSIVDFKGTTRAKNRSSISKYFIQATAYALMLEARTGIRIEDLVILMAGEDGSSQVFKAKRSRYEKQLRKYISDFEKNLII